MKHHTPHTPTSGSLAQRLGWMALIWVVSVLSLGAIAGLMRLLMGIAGMTPTS